MIAQFNNLDDREVELMFKAPILVCILIAGADGVIDKSEIKESLTIAKKQTHSKSMLTHYFEELSQDFEDKVKILIQSYPFEAALRTSTILLELEGLNQIWTKLDKGFAKQFYDALKKIAGQIASSS